MFLIILFNFFPTNNLICFFFQCHFSLFSHNKLNLAELIIKTIKLALSDKTHQEQDKKYYYNVLDKIKLIYKLESDGHEDTSSEPKNKNCLPGQNALEINVNSRIILNNSSVDDNESISSVIVSDIFYDTSNCCTCRIM